MRPGWARGCALACLLWLCASDRAETAPRAPTAAVKVHGLGASAALLGQLTLDLSMLGLTLQWSRGAPNEEALLDALEASGGLVALAFRPEGLLLAERDPRRVTFESLDWRKDAGLEHARIVAQRVVELVRARLRDDGSVPTTPEQGSPEVRVVEDAVASAQPRSLGAFVGSGVQGATGGLPWQASGVLGARIGSGVWDLRGEAWVPLHEPVFATEEGQVRVGTTSFFLGVSRGSQEPAQRWQPRFGADVGLVRLSVEGEAVAPFVSGRDALIRLAGRIHGGVRVQLSRQFALDLGVHAGGAGASAKVDVADRTAARFGPWLLGGYLALELTAP